VLKDGAQIQIGPYQITYRLLMAEDRPKPTESAPVVGAPPQHRESSSGAGSSALRFKSQRTAAIMVAPESVVGSDSRYLSYLPVIFQDNDFLGRYLQIFEAIWEPLEQRQDHISLFFSPRTCPASWLPWFASWFGLEVNPHWPEARSRALLAEAPELYRWRGTKYGLTRMLEVCTGTKPDITEDPAEPFVFRIRVRLPATAEPEAEATLNELIRAHKPAHTGYILEVQR
jgi:phage tail-like protein